ncbi:MAG: Maf family protein [Alphaproteobacteria bacterium]|nr:Maf family protein [Alphaproteobacteria bacterium]
MADLSQAETPKMVATTPVILASASAVRARLLAAAGIAFEQQPAAVDEGEVKNALKSEGASAREAAEALAELKAQHVSRKHPEAFVIGADQILECDGVWFDKPGARADAAASLKALGGRDHELIASVCVIRGGAILWHHSDRASLHVRALDEGFIERYLDAAGQAALDSVGAYQLEGLGANLFTRIDGDYFTILGLPLLPLLDFLRGHQVGLQ